MDSRIVQAILKKTKFRQESIKQVVITFFTEINT